MCVAIFSSSQTPFRDSERLRFCQEVISIHGSLSQILPHPSHLPSRSWDRKHKKSLSVGRTDPRPKRARDYVSNQMSRVPKILKVEKVEIVKVENYPRRNERLWDEKSTCNFWLWMCLPLEKDFIDRHRNHRKIKQSDCAQRKSKHKI